jgi:glutamyl-Q tRNA(Asp) synthetase
MTAAPYIGRFAPSPTGPLHFGSLVAALASYLDAKAHNGHWLVRMEDVDETRCKPEFADDILRTLERFGLCWDGEVVIQSKRKSAYAQALSSLSSQWLTYACVCSRKEIADSAVNGIDGPVYPGTCRAEVHAEMRHVAHPESNNANNTIRLVTPPHPVVFSDRLFGTLSQNLAHDIGDFVLKRRDGLFAYQLAVVVDDMDAGVTDIVRGADLLDSTARQIYITRLLGGAVPRYLHIPVAANQLGQKLSKQTLAAAVNEADIATTLSQALAFLRQPSPDLDPGLTANQLLSHAITHWNPALLPASRTLLAGNMT